jgi:hypothetical protein
MRSGDMKIIEPTKCKLCGKIFEVNLLRDAAIVGNNPQAKLEQVQALITPLMQHLNQKHPEHLQRSQMAGGALAGFLAIDGAFSIDADTKLQLDHDRTRWNIRRILSAPELRVTDERIEERVKEIFDHVHPGECLDRGAIRAAVAKCMRDMRDAIEERDRYQVRPDQSNGFHS